jgi:3',5'-nucleoside bisphosphate phosphatase
VAIALTDHDSLDGVPEARQAGARYGVRVLAGCEFSVKVSWGELHLLGYGLRLDHAELQEELVTAREARALRGRAMVEKIRSFGLTISDDDVARVAKGAAVGRPHLARALIANGVVKSFDEAFDRLLGRGRPAFVAKRLPELAAITALVRRAGGISSAAHLRDRGTRSLLAELAAEGLDGVEVFHPSHSPTVRATLSRLAAELGLLPTGGSDWHGSVEASPSHGSIGAVRIPLAWVDAIEALAAERQAR